MKKFIMVLAIASLPAVAFAKVTESSDHVRTSVGASVSGGGVGVSSSSGIRNGRQQDLEKEPTANGRSSEGSYNVRPPRGVNTDDRNGLSVNSNGTISARPHNFNADEERN